MAPEEMVKHEFDKVLVASTTHITYDDRGLLEIPRSQNELLIANSDYGWFVWLDKDLPDGEFASNYSEAFQALCKYALNLDCNWLRLDCDGPIYENLLTFEW